MNFFKATLFTGIFSIILLNIGIAGQFQVKSLLDRETITLGETVQLILTTNEQNASETPDTTPLSKDFDIISTEKSMQLTMINGNSTALTRWIITLNPKHEGKVTIPRLTIGSQLTNSSIYGINFFYLLVAGFLLKRKIFLIQIINKPH